MAVITFYAGESTNIYTVDGTGSGLGFYGSAFGTSVRIGQYNTKTYITNSNGTVQGAEADNIKYVSPSSAIIGSTGSAVLLRAIPNYQATLNIRATDSTAFQTDNPVLRIYDRSNIDNGPSGVTCKVCEVVHTGLTQVVNGSGNTGWTTPSGSSVTLTLSGNPCRSGSFSGSTDTQHDWYVCLSCTPSSVGSKTQFGLYFEVDYI